MIQDQPQVAPAPENLQPQPDLTLASNWAQALLLAARRLDVKVSPELVRNSTVWSSETDHDQSILDATRSAGLDGQFVRLRGREILQEHLPALLQFRDRLVGIVVGIASDGLNVCFPVDGKEVMRKLSFDQLDNLFSKSEKLQLLLVQERDQPIDTRLESYFRVRPKSWLSSLLTSNWNIMVAMASGSLFGNLLAISTSLFAMQVWDRVVPARSINTLWVLASGVAAALLLEFIMRTVRSSLTDHFGKAADLKLSDMFYARMMDIRNDARPRSPGTLISQLRDLEQVRELLTSSTVGVLIDIPFVLAFLLVIYLLGGPLVMVPLIAIPILLIPGLLAQIPLAKYSRSGLTEAALRNAILMESIYRVEDIKSLQAEPRFRAQWNKVNRVSGDISLKQRLISSIIVNFTQMVQQLAYVGVIIMGVYGILDGSLSFGAVLACSILTSRTIAPLGQVSAVLGRVQNARVSKKGLDDLLALPIDHNPEEDSFHKPALAGRYRFENVAYLYGPDSKPAAIIPKFNIEPGEKIAVLGRVGAGKSTFLRLAAGMVRPSQGRILLDETPLNFIDVADVRRDIGVVLQDSSLFYGTVRENLKIANPLASDEQILEALRITCADQLVLNQPQGLDLMLRESGLGLSGGQRQTLLLARAILRSPSVLVLDEPTASLDEATEVAIIERLKQWMGNRTLIVATHRYPVLSMVDRIIVIDGGRIVRDGPKDQILSAFQSGAQPAPANPV